MKLKANEDKLNHTPQEIKNLNDKLKKLESSHNKLEENVEKINHVEMNNKLKILEEKV